MSEKSSATELLKESSAILAGFKLAVIVLSYIGLGSVASWFVENWYPFTRHIWDTVSSSLGLPQIPLLVKDSLTALVFFIPLGVTALYQIFVPPENRPTVAFKTMAAILGVFLFILVTKNVLSAIILSLDLDNSTLNDSPTIRLVFLILLSILTIFALSSDNGWTSIDTFIEGVIGKFIDDLNLYVQLTVMFFVLALGIYFVYLGSVHLNLQLELEKIDLRHELNIAVLLLGATVFLIWLAAFFAPRKLYVATGASFAFVLAALIFEIILRFKSYIEAVN